MTCLHRLLFPCHSIPCKSFMLSVGLLLSLLLSLLLGGCATPEKRIKANTEVFSTFPAGDQALIREGKIAIGFSPKMVEIAKGRPTYINIRRTADQESTIWRYVQNYQYTTTQPMYVSGPYVAAEWVDVTDSQEFEWLRVEFVDGKATVIEEVQF